MGVTNPYLISRSFSPYDAVLFLPNPDRSFTELLQSPDAKEESTAAAAASTATATAHTCLGLGLGETGHVRAAAVGPGHFYQRPSATASTARGGGSEKKSGEGHTQAAISVAVKSLSFSLFGLALSLSQELYEGRPLRGALRPVVGPRGLNGRNGGLLCLKHDVGTSPDCAP